MAARRGAALPLLPCLLVLLALCACGALRTSASRLRHAPRLQQRQQHQTLVHMAAARGSRPHQIVVYGATGFCGRLVCEYIHSRYAAAPTPLRWAVAGRSEPRLRSLKHDLGLPDGMPHLVVEGADEAAVGALAESTDVVITLVGPYARHGGELVGACARAGTHLVDLTGESLWLKEMITQHHATAAATGARIVPSAGFDSIPADIGAFLVAQHLMEQHGTDADKISYYFGKFGLGGFSGGTMATALSLADACAEDGTVMDTLSDPYLLWPDDVPRPEPRSPRSGGGFGYDPEERAWTAPFPFALHDTKIVHRSGALLGYGGARYREVCIFRHPLLGIIPAALVTAVSAVGGALVMLPGARAALRRVAPASGEGPPRAIRENSFFEITVEGTGVNGARARATVASDQGDPGYQETAKMLAESALALALEEGELPRTPGGGVLTPATAIGMVLVRRLRTAGMTLDVGTM